MIVLSILLAAVGGAPPPPFSLVLLATEGGINPGEERITLAADGSVTVRRWRLAQGGPLEERWAVGPEVVGAVQQALAEAGFDQLPELLNEAHGALVAFSTSLEVRHGDDRRTVTAYRHGTPPPPTAFVTLTTRIRDLILAARPSPEAP